MKVIDNHFEGNPTIFINGLIINGCQTFTLDAAPKVFKKFDVPSNVQQDVYNNYVPKGYKHSQEELDLLIKHANVTVRKEVAKQGYGLDTLIYDEDWEVRRLVAKQRYNLDILLRDRDWIVREEVAIQGYRLDTLVHDVDWSVREEVANQGYGLDILVGDEHTMVRRAAKEKLESLTK